MDHISNKTAVVSGGARGIGNAICLSLLRHGLKNLVIIDIIASENVTLAKEFPATKILMKQGNVINKNEIDTIFKEIQEEFGQIDILVNVAGIFDDRNVERTMAVNSCGVMHTSLAAMSIMSKENGGSGGFIVNIASVAAFAPLYYAPIYTASKYAVIGFTSSMGTEYYFNRTGVKFLSVCPGATKTEMLQYNSDKFILSDMCELATTFINDLQAQSPDYVGECVIRAIGDGTNGGIWITMDEKITKISLPDIMEIINKK